MNMDEEQTDKQCQILDDSKKIVLQKQIGLVQGVSIIVSSMIGSGIFITPGEVLRLCGSIPVAILIWAICGVLIIFGALMYAELGSMMPRGGGDYEYLLQVFGGPVAFLFSWTRLVLATPSSLATGSLSFGNYLLSAIFPCQIPEAPRYLLAVLALLVFTYLNSRSVKWASRIQVVFAAGKGCALIGVLIAGIYAFATGGGKYFKDGFRGTTDKPLDIILSFYSAIFAYGGWNFLNFVIEELEEPDKNLPRSIFIGLGTVTIFYVLVNVAYFAMIPIQQAVASPALAVTALGALYEPLGPVMSILVSLSVFGFLNSCLFTSTRVLFVAARNQHLPIVMSFISVDYLTPMSLLAIIFISIGNLSFIVNMNSFAETFFYCCTSVAFFYLRFKKRHEKTTSSKVHIIFPIIFFITMLFITIISLVQEPAACAGAFALILGGLIFYFVFCVLIAPEFLQVFIDKITVGVQKITKSVFQEVLNES